MNRFALTAALVAAACLGPVLRPAPAVPFTVALFSVQSELESRRDGEYAGEDLTKDQKTELKAILKSLKAIAKPAEDVGDDIKTTGKVAKILEKAFPGEFGAGVVQNLGSRVQSALNFLHTLVVSDRDDLEERLPDLVEQKNISAVEKALEDADDGLASYDAATVASRSTKGLGAAWKALQKGTAAADKDPGGGEDPTSLTCTIAGAAFAALAPSAEVTDATDGLRIIGTDGAFPAAHRTIDLLVTGVTGTGTFSVLTPGSSGGLQEYPINNNTPVLYPATSGSINVTVYDPPNRVAGLFQFDASSPAPRTVINGAFDITAITVQ